MKWAINKDGSVGFFSPEQHSEIKMDLEDSLTYRFSVNKRIPVFNKYFTSKGSLTLDEITTNEEMLDDFTSQLFASEKDLDIQLNENQEEKIYEFNKNQQGILFDVKWRKVLSNEVHQFLDENSNNILGLLLLQRFLQTAHILADPSVVKGISQTDKKDILLFCYLTRLHTLKLIIDNDRVTSSLRKLVEQAYKIEFIRFADYLYVESFSLYVLPTHFKDVFGRYLGSTQQGESDIELDDVVDLIVKDLQKNYALLNGLDKFVSKIINGFYVPRYNLFNAIKRKNSNINSLFIPRLTASIIIGFLPILITGEIYDWYVNIFVGKDTILKNIYLILFSFLCQGIIFSYLSVEIKNYLGFLKLSRVMHIYLFGNFVSLGLCWISSSFSSYTLHSFLNGIVDTKVFYFYGEILGLPPSYILFQSSCSFILGIVLQAVWEDKPITQPL
ncbi:hypothetical protein CIB95_12545 [Lottiidibacillus patelloidae]|uniref:Uncharacterized protein n=1 Tax=Lottiidibacillus patelloidae TaxID=2670334 RepID=A0A263BSU1_9BACI|nr:hypothetical protein [Lottiidibacillus patelloidae]OZM56246.1 hypothetical protein CIB95_12545 [Lottiidibacillus patelloidae]